MNDKKKLKIGLDFDGVIADTQDLKQEQAQELYGVTIDPVRFKEHLVIEDGILTHEQYRHLMNTVCGVPEVGLKMKPVSDMLCFLPKLIEEEHEILVLTAREDSELEVAQKWCADRNLHFPFVSSGYRGDKAAHAQGMDVYIDDGPNIFSTLVSVVPNLYLYSWNYNKDSNVPDGVARVQSWQEFYNHLQGLI